MSKGIKTILYPVSNLAQAKAFYTALFGVEPYMDESYYVAFNAHGQDVGLDPNGSKVGLTAATAYWHVDDIKASLATLVESGATVHQEVRDVGGGHLVASVTDQDDNVTGLVQAA